MRLATLVSIAIVASISLSGCRATTPTTTTTVHILTVTIDHGEGDKAAKQYAYETAELCEARKAEMRANAVKLDIPLSDLFTTCDEVSYLATAEKTRPVYIPSSSDSRTIGVSRSEYERDKMQREQEEFMRKSREEAKRSCEFVHGSGSILCRY